MRIEDEHQLLSKKRVVKGSRFFLDDDLTPMQVKERRGESDKVRAAGDEGKKAWLYNGKAVIVNLMSQNTSSQQSGRKERVEKGYFSLFPAGEILLLGDFNAKTANEQSNMCSKEDYTRIWLTKEENHQWARCSEDNKGIIYLCKELLDLCDTCDLLICNGLDHDTTKVLRMKEAPSNLQNKLNNEENGKVTSTCFEGFCKDGARKHGDQNGHQQDMRTQFGILLADIGFVKLPKVDCKKDQIDKLLDDLSQPFNIYAQQSAIVKSTLCAGLYPNVVAMEEGSMKIVHAGGINRHSSLGPRNRPRWFDGRREVFVHPTSINFTTSEFRHPFMVFLEKVETTKVFLRDTTIISPYALLLFGGPINIQHQTGTVILDGWLKMNAPAQTAVLFKELRLTLCSILQELIQKPKERVAVAEREVIHSIVQLLSDEEKPQC
ncbi:hypothetical protein KI387_009828 [Taxus chinensis]|uniref:Uncharacterized protein n=1 Tax=Taxus chinensis TaxID=29808 RepID=A0AA38FJX8_TAXCH|nr:hypothetical protein KI387_009828 [Taxus chinensis]